MKKRWFQLTAVVLLIFVVLLAAFPDREKNALAGTQTAAGENAGAFLHKDGQLNAGAHMEFGSSKQCGGLDGAWSSDGGCQTVQQLLNRTTEEEAADTILILPGVFLLLNIFQCLLDGRRWSAVQSVCMKVRDYSIYQLQILHLCDGKQKDSSYS